MMETNEIPDGATHVGKHGFVLLVDHMGNDQRIVDAARTSYGKGTKTVSDNRALIRHLLRQDPPHSSPFEMVDFTFLVQCPMSVWRQWIRHRTASVNEYSTRYSEAIDSISYCESNEWRKQSTSNKQGSEGVLSDEIGDLLTGMQIHFHEDAVRLYLKKLELGVARELARDDLPLGTYTRAYWKINLHNLLHFLRLRLDAHAQQEIREFAGVIKNLIEPVVPITMEAFEDFKLNSVTFTRIEIKLLKKILADGKVAESFYANNNADLLTAWPQVKSSERNEFLHKLEVIGLT